MDTGKNELSPEMIKKIISNEEYPEAGDILKLVEGDVITDNHNRRLVDPSLFKLRGKPLSFFDEPYPVMMPEDEKIMRGMSDEIKRKFLGYVESNTGIPPYEMVTIDSIPQLIREQAEYDSIMHGDTYICGFKPKKLITGCTQNLKTQRKLNALEAVFDVIDVDKPDAHGRIWERDLLTRQMMGEQIYLITPRQRKSWMWLKFLQSQSYEIQRRPIVIPPSKKLDLYSVIHMRWPKPDLSKVKLEKPRNILFPCNYLEEMFGPIDSFRTDLLSDYAAEMIEKRTSQNLNDEKKQLTRIIKKARKRK